MRVKRLIPVAAAALAVALAPAAARGAGGASAPSGRYVWSNVTIGAGGFITGVVYSPTQPGLAYLRTDIGGLYRWNALARTWTPLLDWTGYSDWNQLGVESVATDPIHPNVVWAAVGEYADSWNAGNNGAILRSDDYGRTWSSYQLPIQLGSNDQGRDSGERLAVDPNDDRVLYLATRNNGLWKSSDGGRTWARDTAFPDLGSGTTSGLQFVTFDPTEKHRGTPTRRIFVGDADKAALYETTDAGATWSAVAGGPAGLVPIKAQISSTGQMYVVYDTYTGPYWMGAGKLYRFDLATGVASDVTPVAAWYGYDGLAVDPRHPGTVLVATNDRWSPIDTIYRTTDAGATWRDVSASTSLDISYEPYLAWGATPKFGWWIGTVAIDPFDSDHVVYGTGATLYGTYDLGAMDSGGTVTFSAGASRGIEETAVNDLLVPDGSSSCKLISAVSDLGGFCHTSLTASPSTGMSADPILSSGTSLAQSADGSLIVRVGYASSGTEYGAYSTDGGSAWTPFAGEPATTTQGAGHIAVSADGATLVWTPADGTTVRSADRGATWTSVGGLPSGLTPVADPQSTNTFYALDGATGVLYKSTDSGASWTPAATGLPENGSDQLKATTGRSGDLWLSAQDGGLYHSTDAGVTWSRTASAASSYTLGFGAAAPGRQYPTIYQVGTVNGTVGVFMSTDAGAAWTRVNTDAQTWGFIGQAVTGDPHTFGRVYLATNGRGIQTVDVTHRAPSS